MLRGMKCRRELGSVGRKKLVYINIDGFSYSYLERLRSHGRAGGFERLQHDGFLFTALRSGLVSITCPMQGAILCGAWSDRTHNFFEHYDIRSGRVVRHGRTCDAQNAAEALLAQGATVASIHQFMLEHRPCEEGSEQCAYIRCEKEPSDSRDRFALLKDLARGTPVHTGDTLLRCATMPDFTALYIDNIDGLGHNMDYGPYPRRATWEERLCDIEERLELIQQELEAFIAICKQRGFFEDLTVLVTTDHGMTPFWGKSCLPDILTRLNGAGFSTATPENRTRDTQLVALGHDIELSLYAVAPLTEEQMQRIRRICEAPAYIQFVFDRAEMQRRYGFDPRGPEFLLCPVRGGHFCGRDVPVGACAASHDSFDETSQHIFGLLLGGSVAQRGTWDAPTSAIDLLPTILAGQFGVTMRDSTGTLHDGWFAGE